MNRSAADWTLEVPNRPGELAKVTKALSDAGLSVTALRVANWGDRASIRFRAPGLSLLPKRLSRRARPTAA